MPAIPPLPGLPSGPGIRSDDPAIRKTATTALFRTLLQNVENAACEVETSSWQFCFNPSWEAEYTCTIPGVDNATESFGRAGGEFSRMFVPILRQAIEKGLVAAVVKKLEAAEGPIKCPDKKLERCKTEVGRTFFHNGPHKQAKKDTYWGEIVITLSCRGFFRRVKGRMALPLPRGPMFDVGITTGGRLIDGDTEVAEDDVLNGAWASPSGIYDLLSLSTDRPAMGGDGRAEAGSSGPEEPIGFSPAQVFDADPEQLAIDRSAELRRSRLSLGH